MSGTTEDIQISTPDGGTMGAYLALPEAGGPAPALADQHGAPFVPAPEPGEEGCEEGAGRRPVPRCRACRLVQPARRQTAFRQGRIQGARAEPPGFHRPAPCRLRNRRSAFQQHNPPAQRSEAGGILPGAYRKHLFIIGSIYG